MINGLFLATAAVDAAAQAAKRIEGSVTSNTGAGSGVRTKLESLGNDVERLFMLTEALWTLVKECHGLTDADLENVMQEIDLRSGKLDGKRAKEERPICPSCSRRNSGRTPNCMYCGTPLPIKPFATF